MYNYLFHMQIMLGLVTHEPHFCLLREEVQFGKKAKRQTSPDTITFHLLHLSILREYIDYEFSSVKVILRAYEYVHKNCFVHLIMGRGSRGVAQKENGGCTRLN